VGDAITVGCAVTDGFHALGAIGGLHGWPRSASGDR
jgi:hypothetical protein